MLLDINYFNNEDTPSLAYNLIGKFIFRNENGQINHYMITEVEAYHGLLDKASHARFGKTPRNAIMFGKAGYSYIYLCYGVHWLLNIVTGAEGFPAAILIRGIDKTFGPGRVTRKLNINGSFNGKILAPESELWIEELDTIPPKVLELPRVGIDYAEEYRDMPWRFILGS